MTLFGTEPNKKKLIVQRVRELADQADWCHLTIPQRSALYQKWVSDPEIGGELVKTQGIENVRVFLKDTVMKQYMREKRATIKDLLRQMDIRYKHVNQEYIKPVALLVDNNRLYTLSVAKEWRIALLSAYERANEAQGVKTNLVLFTDHAVGRYTDASYKALIGGAADKLDIQVHWIT